jgi:hypothetical protein
MEPEKIRFNMVMDREKHRKLKSICNLSGKTMSEVLLDLINVFINAVEESSEK